MLVGYFNVSPAIQTVDIFNGVNERQVVGRKSLTTDVLDPNYSSSEAWKRRLGLGSLVTLLGFCSLVVLVV